MSLPAILQQLRNQSPTSQSTQLDGIKQTISAMQSIGDPAKITEILLARKNPALAKAMEYVKQNGGDPKTACEKILQENGIDPAEVMSLIK